jgi:hypothetical protein
MMADPTRSEIKGELLDADVLAATDVVDAGQADVGEVLGPPGVGKAEAEPHALSPRARA